jgi:thioesterase domain-containing protein/aryl carrier-like protein
VMPGQGLRDALVQRQITHLVMSPTALAAEPLGEAAASLQAMAVGGEPCPPELVRQYAGRMRFINGYGPTETTVAASLHICDAIKDTRGLSVPLGRALGNTWFLILDEFGQPVPLGATGELHIGGLGVARAYLNRPDLTAERFVPDTFSGLPGARLYRTGDLARWRADGVLAYMGRNDHQVKVRGFRIELGEVETALRRIPGVSEVAVVARQEAGSGSSRLVAFVVAGVHRDALGHWREQARAFLPEHMLPAAMVSLPKLPLSANDKLDRALLMRMPPQDDLERSLAALWQELLHLGTRPMDRQDNFFELGGHSLSAVRLMARLKAWGVDLPLSALFAHPSLAELAAHIRLAQAQAGGRGTSQALVLRAGAKPEVGPVPAPLFLLHDISGEVWPYLPLVQHIDDTVPVHGLPLLLPEAQGASMQTMAASAVLAIREVQPQGPYRVGGWSFGGLLAHEVAAQLVDAGQAMSRLIMIDTAWPGDGDLATADGAQVGQGDDEGSWLKAYLMSQVEGDQAVAVQAWLQAQLADASLADLVSAAQQGGLLPKGVDVEAIRTRVAISRALVHAAQQHRPRKLALPITFIDAAALSDQGERQSAAWLKGMGADQVDTIAFEADHWQLMREPMVGRLAAVLNPLLLPLEASPAEPGLIANKADMQASAMLCLQAGKPNGAVPLFCVPGAGATVTGFLPLVESLGSDVPVYGFQARGLDGLQAPQTTVEETAACHLKALLAVRAQGPYRLVGHSYGGWIVLEMARQLRALGHAVAPIVVLDGDPPSDKGVKRRQYQRTEALIELLHNLSLSSGKPCAITIDELAALDDEAQLARILQWMVDAGVMHARTQIQAVRGLVNVFVANINTMYRPATPFDGEIVLVQTGAKRGEALDPASAREAWRAQGSGLRAMPTQGNHMTMLNRPHIDTLWPAWWPEGN